MKFLNEKLWNTAQERNNDFYGSGVMRYAQRWAEMMEDEIEQGNLLTDVAKETSHKSDEEGISGFMYGWAVQILSQTWVHGEELRKWHNLDTQIGNEGEKANETNGCLNPAVFTIKE